MVDLLLIYPYFNDNRSIFKFPPLGIGYIASYVKRLGFSVEIIDCTFLVEDEVVSKVSRATPRVIGIYSMLSMKESALRLARRLKGFCELMVAGGPLPTTYPAAFLKEFDAVVIGEGEETVGRILESLDDGGLPKVDGIAYRGEAGSVRMTPPQKHAADLDLLPFPARELYDHAAYKRYFRRHHGYTITSMITSRGCPFDCDFCSRPVFGASYRGRSPANIVDEMESIAPYDYDRVWLADDIFPLNRKRGVAVCDEIVKRGLDVRWECLCRVDLMSRELAVKMKQAGCHRVFFGLESGNDAVLRKMKKRISVEQSRRAVDAVTSAGIKAGAFFILGYPGESSESMLDTIRFASSLPLNYLSFTVPYPIPGTGLHERLKDRMVADEWVKAKHDFTEHVLLYKSEFSMPKLKFGITKAKAQYNLRRHLGSGYFFIGGPFEAFTDLAFKLMK